MNDRKKTTDPTQAMLDRARRYCAMAEQCESNVRQKLIGWGASTADIDSIIDRLRDENYLDDERYARAYCESKMLHQHWGRQKVLYQLRLKHLPKDAIDSGMVAVADEAYMAMLAETAGRKLADLGGADAPDAVRRLTAFLASRGFSFEDINKSIKTYIQ